MFFFPPCNLNTCTNKPHIVWPPSVCDHDCYVYLPFIASLLLALLLTFPLHIQAQRHSHNVRSNLPKQPCILGHSSNGTGENRELIRPSESSHLLLYMFWISISVEINNRHPIWAESAIYFEADFTAAVRVCRFLSNHILKSGEEKK